MIFKEMKMKKLLIIALIFLVTPFASADWYFNFFTGMLDYYEPVSGSDMDALADVTFTLTARGDIIYRGATAWNNLAKGGAGTLLTMGANDPAWTTATYPATTTINRILYSSAANVVGQITSANSGVLVTSGTGVPSIATDIPTAVTIGSAYIYRVGGTDVAVADGGTNISSYAIGDLLYASTTGVLSKLADVAAGKYLRSGGVNTAPLWSTLTLPNAATAFRLAVATSANTIGELAAVGATGEYLKGNTGAIPSWATLNQAAVAGLTTASSPSFAGISLTGNLALVANSITGTSVDINNAELQQLSAIGATTISGTQWGYLGALDQGLTQASSPTFVGATFSGLTASVPVVTSAGKALASVSYATFKSSLAIAQADVSGLTTASSPTFASVTGTAGFLEGAIATATPSSAFTVDWTTKQTHQVTITGVALDITFTNPSGPCTLTLYVIQGDGDDTIDWTNEADLLFPGGVDPVLTTTSGAVDIITIKWDGTSYHGVANYDFK